MEDASMTILSINCHFIGKLYCKGTSRIAGRIEGEIISEGLLVLEETADITAVVQGEEVVIAGRMKGKLHALDRLEFTSTSVFEGTLQTPCLVVQEGAHLQGQIEMALEETMSSEQENVTESSSHDKFDLPLTFEGEEEATLLL